MASICWRRAAALSTRWACWRYGFLRAARRASGRWRIWRRKDVHVIAVANPKLAPYGAAAVETLQHAGIWDRVKDKIVYAENISMAKQYGASKNADAVFTAYSLVLKEAGAVIQVDEAMHQPIVQKLGIVAASQHRDWAQSFSNFVLKGAGRAILARYGYKIH